MSKKDYAVYLFDLDGTLTNTTQIWIDVFKDALASFSITDIPDKVIAQHTHDWNSLTAVGLPPDSIEDFARAARELAPTRLQAAPLHEGATEMLASLRIAGKKIGIFTSVNRPILESIMNGHPLSELVDIMVAGTDVPHYKPHPAGIHHALGLLNVLPSAYETVVYIGDKDTDIMAAQNAGIDVCSFFRRNTTGYTTARRSTY